MGLFKLCDYVHTCLSKNDMGCVFVYISVYAQIVLHNKRQKNSIRIIVFGKGCKVYIYAIIKMNTILNHVKQNITEEVLKNTVTLYYHPLLLLLLNLQKSHNKCSDFYFTLLSEFKT